MIVACFQSLLPKLGSTPGISSGDVASNGHDENRGSDSLTVSSAWHGQVVRV